VSIAHVWVSLAIEHFRRPTASGDYMRGSTLGSLFIAASTALAACNAKSSGTKAKGSVEGDAYLALQNGTVAPAAARTVLLLRDTLKLTRDLADSCGYYSIRRRTLDSAEHVASLASNRALENYDLTAISRGWAEFPIRLEPRSRANFETGTRS
jgi:hypothetical protein